MAKQWSHGLFGCFDDCPCYTAGKNAEAVGESCVLCGLPLVDLFSIAQIRSKIREQKGIDGTFVNDLIV